MLLLTISKGLVARGLEIITRALLGADDPRTVKAFASARGLYARGELDSRAWDAFFGTYEDSGLLSPLFEVAWIQHSG